MNMESPTLTVVNLAVMRWPCFQVFMIVTWKDCGMLYSALYMIWRTELWMREKKVV